MQFHLTNRQWLGPHGEVELKEGLRSALEENGFTGTVSLQAIVDAQSPSYKVDIRFGKTCFGNLEPVKQAAQDYFQASSLGYDLTELF